MTLCGLFALVLGYLLGLRFRVAAVLPIEMAALAAVAVMGAMGHMPFGQACLGFAVFSVVLQTGYALALVCPLPNRRAAPRKPLKA